MRSGAASSNPDAHVRREDEDRALWRRLLTPTTQKKLLASFLLAVLIVAFALDNSQRVTVDYLVMTRESRLVWVIVASAVLGALADRLLVRHSRR